MAIAIRNDLRPPLAILLDLIYVNGERNIVTAADFTEKRKRLSAAMALTHISLCNMDISRIPNPTDKDRQRLARYGQEYQQLYEMLNKMYTIPEN